ncbi:putative F-box protein At3g10240 [Salvia miltiorrhiza]|uniref:putative F-box protein At3g10240 n=1 Tax=Salvia miltiorrhiza TaxID=226208 RepID=UPI0025AC678A|nr:putative F-box protein At3g10240 [Salvia miltiorrhiza]XP_057796004.1 putative F-box protein At3g10240 [Salvia miltiorrhiza]
MEPDLFKYVPSEIMSNIFSRLHSEAVAISKCVCKAWLHLLETDYFVNSYLCKPSLAVLARDSTRLTVFNLKDEDEDEDGVDHDHDRHYIPVADFDIPQRGAKVKGTSANGLLLVFSKPKSLCICNPLTRDYVELCCPQQSIRASELLCGFGVSKISGRHKVVCMTRSESHCHVYTLGATQTWRTVAKPSGVFCDYAYGVSFGQLVKGNLHWKLWGEAICCFDVETECFSRFSTPPRGGNADLSVLQGCLCACRLAWDKDEGNEVIEIWLMKEYGDDESWSKEYVMIYHPDFPPGPAIYPIKVFKDGDILMLLEEEFLLYYSNNTKNTQQVHALEAATGDTYISAIIFTPTLSSLKTLGMENVISLNSIS